MGRPKKTNVDKSIEALHKAYSFIYKVTQEDIIAAVAPIFQQNPDIQQISWTQYTPSFSDGEPCTFRSGHCYPEVVRMTNIETGETKEDQFFNDDLDGGNSLYRIPDEIMLHLFGSDVEVVINSKLELRIDDYPFHD